MIYDCIFKATLCRRFSIFFLSSRKKSLNFKRSKNFVPFPSICCIIVSMKDFCLCTGKSSENRYGTSLIAIAGSCSSSLLHSREKERKRKKLCNIHVVTGEKITHRRMKKRTTHLVMTRQFFLVNDASNPYGSPIYSPCRAQLFLFSEPIHLGWHLVSPVVCLQV